MPANILKDIVRHKRIEVQNLYQLYKLEDLQQKIQSSSLSFYQTIASKAEAKVPFIISEFKRKSPSEGWINRDLSISHQLEVYKKKGANAVSVLTDEQFFGGDYQDLKEAARVLADSGILLLQKDFVIDPIQIYLGRLMGANMVLLIAAILEPEEMKNLKLIAESLGMGVLAEVHSVEEYRKIETIGFPVVGVNNRDLTNFKTALNCCNYIAREVSHQGYIIAESGMGSALDLQIASRCADGFLIGTSLMRKAADVPFEALTEKRYFFKACGIRNDGMMALEAPDLLGINFSPISKRRGAEGWLEGRFIPSHAVAVFKNNTADEVNTVVEKYGFHYVQLYADDFEVDFVKNIKQKVILAIAVRQASDIEKAYEYAPYIDFFILDGATPGSGELIEFDIPTDFPYPFLLAGGITAANLDRIIAYDHCIGVDMASGIETNRQVDPVKIQAVKEGLQALL